MALSRVLCPTLVGRDPEISTLEDALLSALRGDGGVVIVGGEAGMGKTRIVNALGERARRLGCAVISGGCSEAELSLPYLPFLEAIGNYLATAEIGPLRERLDSAADELAQLFPQLGRAVATTGDAAQAKMRLFESILMLLRDAATRRALLVILEDLQWADPATRELLDYATRRLRSTNVLIVATYRTDEMHRKHALLPTIQGWRRNGQVEMVDLNSLSAEQVGDMVCAIFEEETISAEFRDFLRERSEGNPFVLEEMLRDALDRGDIFRTDTGWDRKTLTEIRIPPTVRDTILQRLERLSREDVAVLAAASVMGRSFDLPSLAEVARVDESVALAALEASVTAQLTEQEDRVSGRYRFRHALTREAIYDDLVVPRRQQLHSRVADVLGARGGEAPIDLANHLFMAGRHVDAVAMCVAAAEDAIRGRAYRDAAELLERGAGSVSDPIERARMFCRAADAYWNNSEPANARRLLEEGITDLETAGLAVEAAGHRVLLGRCWWELMRTDLAREHFEKARAVLEPAGPSGALAIVYIRLAGLAMFSTDPAGCVQFATQAVKTAEACGAELARAWALIFLSGGETGLGRVTEGFQRMEEGYLASVAGDFPFQVGNAVFNAAWEALHLAHGEQIAIWYRRAGKIGYAADGWPRYVQGLIGLERGEIETALEAGRNSNQLSRDSGYQKMVWRSAVLQAHALAESLRPEEAAAVLPSQSSRVDAQDATYDTGARVRTCLAAGDVEGAAKAAMTVEPSICNSGSPADVVAEAVTDPAWLRAFVEALAVRGEVTESPRLAAARGRLALLEDRVGEAVELLRQADAGFMSAGLRLDCWHLGRALGEAEFRLGHREAAESRLKEVVASAAAAGALLAAKLAAETAARLGLDTGAVPAQRQTPTGRPVATGERMVSVLFADVRGYSELAGRTSPADLADRIGSLQRWARHEVDRRHGVVDKFAGDAIMATFNVSGQSVDHAVQALRAALAIIDKAALAGLPVGAGVAVGPAVVGNLAESANLSVLGEVTNLASRLQARAAAGQVLLSEEVYRRAAAWLEQQRISVDQAELELKGFAVPVVAYVVNTAVPETALV